MNEVILLKSKLVKIISSSSKDLADSKRDSEVL